MKSSPQVHTRLVNVVHIYPIITEVAERDIGRCTNAQKLDKLRREKVIDKYSCHIHHETVKICMGRDVGTEPMAMSDDGLNLKQYQ